MTSVEHLTITERKPVVYTQVGACRAVSQLELERSRLDIKSFVELYLRDTILGALIPVISDGREWIVKWTGIERSDTRPSDDILLSADYALGFSPLTFFTQRVNFCLAHAKDAQVGEWVHSSALVELPPDMKRNHGVQVMPTAGLTTFQNENAPYTIGPCFQWYPMEQLWKRIS